MVSKRMLGLGTARSVIRELFEYGNQRAPSSAGRTCMTSLWATPASPPLPR